MPVGSNHLLHCVHRCGLSTKAGEVAREAGHAGDSPKPNEEILHVAGTSGRTPRHGAVRTSMHVIRLLPVCIALLFATLFLGTAQTTNTASSGSRFFVTLPATYPASNHYLRASIVAVGQCTVTVLQTENGQSETRTLMPGEVWDYLISRTRIMLLPGEGKSKRSLQITSSGLVTVNLTSDGDFVTDNFMAFPIYDYGHEYYTLSAPSATNLGGVFAVVATEDNTQVRITPSVVTANGNLPSFTYAVTLNRGEVYQVTPKVLEETDITGSRVTSDKPVVVYSGHAGAFLPEGVGGAQNAMMEQMIPVVDWGRRFYARPLPGQSRGFYKVVASQNGTVVRRNGLPIATLKSGEAHTFMFEEPVIIEGSLPIMAAQFTTHFIADSARPNSDPSMMLLNPIDLFSTNYQWMTPYLLPRYFLRSNPKGGPEPDTAFVPFTHYLMVTAPKVGRTSVRLDGKPIDFDSYGLPHGDGKYVTAIVSILAGVHQITSSVPVNAQAFGYSHYDAYSSPAGTLVRDALRSDDLTARTCNDYLDTIIQLQNIGGRELEVISGEFSGINGEVVTPGSYPFFMAKFANRWMRLRIPLPRYGAYDGTLTLTTKTSAGRPLQIPIHIDRDSMGVQLSLPSLAFPTVDAGGTPKTEQVMLVNTGTGPATLTKAEFTGAFTLADPALPATVQPGDTLRLTIRFAPGSSGIYNGVGTFTIGPCLAPIPLTLRGERLRGARIEAYAQDIPPLSCSTPSSQPFMVSIRNTGQGVLRVDSVRVQGAYASDFIFDAVFNPTTILPDSTLLVPMRFVPTGVGNRMATAQVYSSAAGSAVVDVLLSGRKDSVGISLSDPWLNLGTLSGCDPPTARTLRIFCTGTLPIQFDSATVSGSSFMLSGFSAPSIGVGESATVTVTFQPTGPGIHSDTLRLYAEPCGLVKTIPLWGEQRSAGIGFSTDTLEFGAIAQCQAPFTKTFRIVNTGAVRDTITSLTITSGLFAVGAVPTRLTLGPGEQSAPITVTFQPSGIGEFAGNIELRAEPCGLVQTLHLRGAMLPQSIAVDSDIDLGRVRNDSLSVGGALLSNSGGVPVVVRSISFYPSIPGLRVVSPQFPIKVDAGQQIPIQVEYLSSAAASFTTNGVAVADSPCVAVDTFTVRGEWRRDLWLQLRLTFPDTTAQVGDWGILPLRYSVNTPSDAVVTVEGELRWDAGLFFPESFTTQLPGVLTARFDSVSGGERVVMFRYSGALSKSGVLGSLAGRVMLGGVEQTPLRIANPVATARIVSPLDSVDGEVTVTNGSLKIIDFCGPIGNRLLEFSPLFRIASLTPNPANHEVTLGLELPSPGRVVVSVLNPVTDEIARPFDSDLPAGAQQLPLPIQGIATGTYYLRVRFGGEERIARLVIVR
ncbi:MAG: choice-of-anchor D domain-containing protein [Armatimonadetes bacterium]|nr:choice-of-anchor D domain-containing protein [Armatimonadota bacterium]